MNAVDLKVLIERAKTAAAATGVSTPTQSLDSLVDEMKLSADDALIQKLVAEIEGMAAQEETTATLQKKAAAERARNLAVAKALAAIDILSEVR